MSQSISAVDGESMWHSEITKPQCHEHTPEPGCDSHALQSRNSSNWSGLRSGGPFRDSYEVVLGVESFPVK